MPPPSCSHSSTADDARCDGFTTKSRRPRGPSTELNDTVEGVSGFGAASRSCCIACRAPTGSLTKSKGGEGQRRRLISTSSGRSAMVEEAGFQETRTTGLPSLMPSAPAGPLSPGPSD